MHTININTRYEPRPPTTSLNNTLYDYVIRRNSIFLFIYKILIIQETAYYLLSTALLFDAFGKDYLCSKATYRYTMLFTNAHILPIAYLYMINNQKTLLQYSKTKKYALIAVKNIYSVLLAFFLTMYYDNYIPHNCLTYIKSHSIGLLYILYLNYAVAIVDIIIVGYMWYKYILLY